MIAELRNDSISMKTMWVLAIIFDCAARQVIPLTRLPDFAEPEIAAAADHTAALGAALELLLDARR